MPTAARVRRAGVVFGLADRPPPTAASRPRPTTSLQSARAPGASSITHSAMAAMLCSASWSVICPPSSPATAAISPISRRARRQVCGSRIPIPAERPGPTPVHAETLLPSGEKVGGAAARMRGLSPPHRRVLRCPPPGPPAVSRVSLQPVGVVGGGRGGGLVGALSAAPARPPLPIPFNKSARPARSTRPAPAARPDAGQGQAVPACRASGAQRP